MSSVGVSLLAMNDYAVSLQNRNICIASRLTPTKARRR